MKTRLLKKIRKRYTVAVIPTDDLSFIVLDNKKEIYVDSFFTAKDFIAWYIGEHLGSGTLIEYLKRKNKAKRRRLYFQSLKDIAK